MAQPDMGPARHGRMRRDRGDREAYGNLQCRGWFGAEQGCGAPTFRLFSWLMLRAWNTRWWLIFRLRS